MNSVPILAFVLLLTLAAVACAAPATQSVATTEPDLLKTLRPEHPRLFLTKDSLAALRQSVKTDSQLAAVFANVKARADKILATPTDRVSYTIIGPRLLNESRRAMHNIATLSLVYLLTNDHKYADLATSEMLAAAGFKDWNPSHFLDTAEMTNALAIGYDWLYDSLTPAQRTTIKNAILTHGLNAGLTAYRGQAAWGWWTRATHNWSQVCNGGLAVGALAIADEGTAEGGAAREVLASGLKAVQGAMAHFDADGGWDEGPGYWAYTTQYTAYYLDALRTATGSMHGLDKTTGLDNAGAFRMHFVGPSGKTFNFADGGDTRGSPSQMFFLARTFNRPEYAWHHRQEKLDHPFDLIWFDPRGTDPDKTHLPTAKEFRAIDVACLRSSWADDATFIGFKGGNNAANHSHLDLGCFVLDVLGKRFILDLGGDEYNMPGYFGHQRWTYYRLKTEGHDTLLIDNANQPTKAKARLVAFSAADSCAIADLSAAYPMTTKTLRGVRLLGPRDARNVALIQDDISTYKEHTVAIHLHTAAKVELPQHGSPTLTLDGKVLRLQIMGDASATVTAEPLALAPPQKPAKGITRITVSFTAKPGTTRVALLFTPYEQTHYKLEPLTNWPGWSAK